MFGVSFDSEHKKMNIIGYQYHCETPRNILESLFALGITKAIPQPLAHVLLCTDLAQGGMMINDLFSQNDSVRK